MDQKRATEGLTPAEVAAVLRRATELDSASAVSRPLSDSVSPEVVEEAGVEAGISREALRRALAERVVAPTRPGPLDLARPGVPDRVEVIRDVPGPSRDVSGRVERYLRRQVLTRDRIFENGSRWVPRRGPFSLLRRWLGRRSRHEMRPVRSVELRVADDPSTQGRVLVRLDADLSTLRRRHAGGAAATAVALVGGSGWLVAMNGPELLLVVVPLSTAGIAGAFVAARSTARRAVVQVETALHRVIDRIEHGPADARAALKAAVRAERDAALREAADRLGEAVSRRADVPRAGTDG